MKMISEIGIKPEGTQECINTKGSTFEKEIHEDGIRQK